MKNFTESLSIIQKRKGKQTMKNLRIENITKRQCEEFLNKHHYLSKQGCGFRSGFNYGLHEEDGTLIGVAIFHTVSAWETVKGCFGLQNKEQKGFWELGRFAIDSEHNTNNLSSWFLSRAIKRLRSETTVRALITYADSEVHNGTLYQACNFRYYGLTAPKNDFWIEQADGTLKKQSRGKTKGVAGVWKPRSRKHRYLLIFDKTLRTKWIEQPYPKGTI